jgi:NAD(P)-dependent dehydrogenase (short-subunit alcohol dehydrogenase family)
MGKYIIIGTSGIGAAIARRLHKQGRDLHLISRSPHKVGALAEELGASRAVADVMDVAALNAAIIAAGPVVDGLCYAVGSMNFKPATRLTDTEAIKDFELNALGALRSVNAALPALKASTQENASVVMFSTVAVQQGFVSHASIAMSKGAVEGLTRTLAAEFAPKIRVNAIAPSLTRTPLAAALTANETMAKGIAAAHPLQRLGEADDVAALAVLLLSADASWITGQVIGVDGGRSTLRAKG